MTPSPCSAATRSNSSSSASLGLGKIEPTTLVFSTIEGELLSPDKLSRDWRRVRAAKKLPPVPFHALRHTHAKSYTPSNWQFPVIGCT